MRFIAILVTGLKWLYRALLRRGKPHHASPVVVTLLITGPDGTQRVQRLEYRPELEDVPLEVALGLTPGDRVELQR
jgi:hypothetical protein